MSLFLTILKIMLPSYYETYSSYLVAFNLGIQLADAVGPVFGGLLFPYLGYVGIFALLSLICFSTAFLLLCFKPLERSNPYQEPNEATTLSYWSLFSVPVRRSDVKKYGWDQWHSSFLRASTSQSTRSFPSSSPASSVWVSVRSGCSSSTSLLWLWS